MRSSSGLSCSTDGEWREAVVQLHALAARLTGLKALFPGEVVFEESELSCVGGSVTGRPPAWSALTQGVPGLVIKVAGGRVCGSKTDGASTTRGAGGAGAQLRSDMSSTKR